MIPQFPQPDQYMEAMQNPQVTLLDALLKTARVEKTPMDLPFSRSGGFVATYHLSLYDGREKAVRCYYRYLPDLFQRYSVIKQAIRQPALSDLFLNVDYQQNGILVNGQYFPILLMDWVKGLPLNAWVENHLNKGDLLSLEQQFLDYFGRLEASHIAHGDLQHGNILVDMQGKIRLIDYDSIFAPALAGYTPYDRGHPNFQHPQRQNEFNDRIDRFPAIVILLALKALQYDPKLWQDFGLSGENLLFTQKDFLQPDTSLLLQRMENIPACKQYIQLFRDCCKGRFEAIPSIAIFLGTPNITIKTATQPAIPWEQMPLFSAETSNDTLNQFNQNQIMIVGKVRQIRRKIAINNRPYAQIIFSNAYGFLALVFSEGLDQFAAVGRSLDALEGHWVRMVMNLNVYSRDPSFNPRPQFIIEYPSQIGIITEDEAMQLLKISESTPKSSPNSGNSQNEPPSPTSRVQKTYISPRQNKQMLTQSTQATPNSQSVRRRGSFNSETLPPYMGQMPKPTRVQSGAISPPSFPKAANIQGSPPASSPHITPSPTDPPNGVRNLSTLARLVGWIKRILK